LNLLVSSNRRQRRRHDLISVARSYHRGRHCEGLGVGAAGQV